MAKLYSCSAVAGFIQSAVGFGYEVKRFRPESLGYGGIVLVAPEGFYNNIVIEEKYINEWSSGHTVRSCHKISKRIQKLIAEYEKEYGNE